MLRKLFHVTRWFARREKIDNDMDAELRFHLDQQTELNMQNGMKPDEARRAAAMSLGGLDQTKELGRDARSGRIVETVLQDVRYGLRILRNNPGFTGAAMLILALGIGLNTAMFSIVYGVLLRPLPYSQGNQLVVLHQKSRVGNGEIPFSYKEINDYRTSNHTLSGVVEHHTMAFLLLGNDTAERVQTAVVSANFFDVLGVKPLHGRTFVAADEVPGTEAVLILSHKYWRERHGGDPAIVGRVFQMNNRPHTVIGVLPPIPQYPSESHVYMPTSQCPTRSSQAFMAARNARMMTAFGRLKPGVRLEEAQADLSTISKQLESAYPESYPKQSAYGMSVIGLQDDLTRRGRKTFFILLGAAGLVLLIACANVANLLLSRLLKLERELAVRTALGASRMRLVRQLLTESMLLSIGGGLLGVAVAPLALKLLVRFAERFTTRAAEVQLDAPVLIASLLISLFAGLLFGLAPALWSSKHSADAMRQGNARSTTSPVRQRLRDTLVIAQVAVSFVLLVGAGLMTRSLYRMIQENPGFRTERLLTMRVTPNFTKYNTPDSQRLLFDRVFLKLRTVGGAESFALASNFPFNPRGLANGPGYAPFQIEGKPLGPGELAPKVDVTSVGPTYFETIGQGLAAGRLFNEYDKPESQRVIIINQTMAKHRWPNEDPIGKRVTLNNGRIWLQIVGVVADAKEYGLDQPVPDELYLAASQLGPPGNLVVRTSIEPTAVQPLVIAALRDVDAQIAIDEVATMERLREDSMASPRLTAALLGLFALLALLISASGIASVIALSVTERTRELGIRIALGAAPRSIVAMVVRQGLVMGIAGTTVGLLGSLALARVLSTLLYDTSPTDALTLATVSAFFLATTFAASLIPARQVTGIDPLVALRDE